MRLTAIALIAAFGAAGAAPAGAQRRPIGADETERVQVPDEDEAATAEEKRRKQQAAEEAEKKKAEEERAKAEAEKKSILEQEQKRAEAEKAARMKAEEARRKKEEDEKRQQLQEEAKKKAVADKRHRAELKAARTERVLLRTSGPIRLRVMLRPGAPEVKAVEEVRIDLAEKLEVPDPTFGEYKPLTNANMVATVAYVDALEEAPATGKKRGQAAPDVPEPLRYRVHPLEDAGVYGFHTTMLAPGKYEVKLEGKDAKGRALEGSFHLYPGLWPPPDWDQERSKADAASGRRRPILLD